MVHKNRMCNIQSSTSDVATVKSNVAAIFQDCCQKSYNFAYKSVEVVHFNAFWSGLKIYINTKKQFHATHYFLHRF